MSARDSAMPRSGPAPASPAARARSKASSARSGRFSLLYADPSFRKVAGEDSSAAALS